MRQMEVSLDDLDGEESFGFDDLSLERYRQELLGKFNRAKEKYKRLQKGVYSGFLIKWIRAMKIFFKIGHKFENKSEK